MNNVRKVNENMVRIANPTYQFDKEIEFIDNAILLNEEHTYMSPDIYGDAVKLLHFQGYNNGAVASALWEVQKGRWFKISNARVDGLTMQKKDLWGFFSGTSLYVTDIKKEIYNSSRVI